jgi:hypothetical protein
MIGSLTGHCVLVVIPWDVERYASRLPKLDKQPNTQGTVEKLASRYPPLHPDVHLTDPAIIVDMHGRIIAWYLPNIIVPPRQVCMMSL